MEATDFEPISIEELIKQPLGITAPMAVAAGYGELLGSKRNDVLAGALYVAQFHDNSIAEKLRDKLFTIESRYMRQGADGNMTRVETQQKEKRRVKSVSAVAGATEMVHQIANSMENASRKEVIAACVAKGINPNTAKTQYYRWAQARKTAA